MEMISIIIPTLNEEDNLSKLLEFIKKQEFSNYEIIISDAGSKDKTLEIAKRYNCVITKGGLPAKGRNEGAKISKGEILFFMDADIYFSEDFLNKSLKEFKERNLDIASFRIIPKNNKMATILFNLYYNYPMIVLEKILPHSAMGILVKRDLFFKLNGFNEEVVLGEDHDFGRRAAKIGKFGIIRGVIIFTSTRRFEKDGWLKTFFKYSLCQLYMIFIGPVKKDIFKYNFDHYNEEKNKK